MAFPATAAGKKTPRSVKPPATLGRERSSAPPRHAAPGVCIRARPAIKRRVLGKNAACATRTRVGDRLDGLGTGPVPACRLLV